MIPFTPPKFNLKSFNCPNCNAYSHQRWQGAYYSPGGGFQAVPDLDVAYCDRCGKYSVWRDGKMISPEKGVVNPPNSDLRDDIQEDYSEANSILNKSPR